MRYFIYKKEKKEFVPVKSRKANKQAKVRLEEIYNSRDKLRIPSRFASDWKSVALFHTQGDVDRAGALILPEDNFSIYALNNNLNDLCSREWLPETVTVFSQRGLGASSKDAAIEKQHPAPFSFQDVARLILFYSKENDRILDPFSGVASTVKACALNNRHGYGIELNPKYHELGMLRLEQEVPQECPLRSAQVLINGNTVTEIEKFEDGFFDFIVTSPPYWNILDTVDHKGKERVNSHLDHKYSDNSEDLANIKDYGDFVETLSSFFDRCASKLSREKYMAVIVSDFRKKDKYYVFHADLANAIEQKGSLKLKGIRILYQRHKSIYPYGYPNSFVPNIHHQNVLIFQKRE